ncbi:hypothetical protein P170DRAFT_470087 [Aspergillus steynii IBT 23096]|uniref:Mid2 domain-containing protein n=1 Tax=Aspergillus steynii IBT 23096 TaxID=1392250 RepID=A0A2I2GP44_9EURO|nr:uncharacterized protein P170DRAFT_470087 [Aspergillus steynii IBT 23096]PLB54633.1 hypothetical protein P170DRAFT_470087 [Aspergillus steynii IBT 23096]
MTKSQHWSWTGLIAAFHIGCAVTSTTTHPPWFNGYYVHFQGGATQTETISCEKTSSFATSGSYANCCGTKGEKCPMPTTCLDHTVYMDNGAYYKCGTSSECATMTVYETYPFGEPFVKNVFCWPDWDAHTVYRQLPTFPTSTAATTTGLSASAGSTVPQATVSSTSTSTGTSAADSDSDSRSDSSSNKGWIAGAVVGPVCGVALGLFGVWVGYRKAQKARAMQAEAALAPQVAQSQYIQGGGYPQEAYGRAVYAQPHVELDSSNLHQKP